MAISLGGFSGGGAGAVTSVNTQTGAVVLSGDDLAADHTASNYTAANANIDGHLSGIDTKLGTLAAGLTYKGTFDASAGTPSLTNALQGDLYIIDTAGTLYGQTWAVGDHLLVNEDMGGSITNSKIDKVDNTDQVTSVNGDVGAVSINLDSVTTEGNTTTNTLVAGVLRTPYLRVGTSALNNYQFPTADGTLAQVIATDGAGGLYWKDDANDVTSVNTQTGAVVLSGDDLAADHTAVNYTASNANIDGHLAGIDSALGASASPTLDDVTTNGDTTTNAINVGTVTTSGDILADSADTRTIGAEDTRFITYYGDMNGAIRFKAKNDEGAQITKGQAVYIKGLAGDGTTPTVGLADANDPAKMPAFGLAFNTANNNAEIQIISVGNLGGLNTSGFSVGDTLFVDTTAGALTDTKPTGESSQLQNIGRVIRSDNGAGVIMVGGAGRSAATPNLDQDKVFLGNASNQAVSTALSAIGLSKFSNDSAFISDITNESLNDLNDVSFTAGAGIDNYVLTYDNATTSWGAEAVPSAPVSSVNTLTGAVVLSANDLAADHTASNYTAANANIDGHLSGIDSKLGTLTAGLTYKGSFNASAGTPSLTNALQGDLYIIDTAGTIYGQTWAVGDHLLVNEDMGGSITNSKIDKVDNTDQVTSVNGDVGAVSINLDSVTTEGNSTTNTIVAGVLRTPYLRVGTSALSNYQFPTADGTLAQVIATDGAGGLYWKDDANDVTSVNTQTGAVVLSANDLAADHTAVNYTAANANIDGHLSGIDSKLASQLESGDNISLLNNNSGFISDITGESLNDLNDVSFTAGAGIDNYVLKYDHATTSWGAEAESTAAAASETVAGVIEIATNAEATAGTATDKALVPSNISSLDLSAMDNTTSAFISDITSESLNDLSDVSFTAGAGIDNYVLTYDHATTSWGAEAAAGGAQFDTTITSSTNYTASSNEIISLTATNLTGPINVTLPSSPSDGDIIILNRASGSNGYQDGAAAYVRLYESDGTTLLRNLQFTPARGSIILAFDGTEWAIPVTFDRIYKDTSASEVLYASTFGRYVLYADGNSGSAYTVTLQMSASSILEGASQRIICRGDRDVTITSPSNDIVDPTDGASTETLTNSVTVPAHGGMIEIIRNGNAEYIISAPLANLSDVAFSGAYSDLSGAPAAPASATETTEGLIEIATNAEATAGTATDKALVPSNISSLDLSAMNNTTSGFIADITGESLNDLSDVSYTAGAGIDNYVLTYDHATTSWGAEAVAGGSAPSVTAQNTTATLSTPSSGTIEEIYTVNSSSAVTLTLVSAATVGEGFKYQVKRLGTGAVTIDPASTEYIDHSGQSTFNIGAQYDSVTLVSDGTNWLLI